jgi:hypothetical protein
MEVHGKLGWMVMVKNKVKGVVGMGLGNVTGRLQGHFVH